jgi:hypothetical protein
VKIHEQDRFCNCLPRAATAKVDFVLSNITQQRISSEAYSVEWIRYSQPIMEFQGLLPCSRDPTAVPYFEPVLSSEYHRTVMRIYEKYRNCK